MKDGMLLFGPIAYSRVQQFHQGASMTINDAPPVFCRSGVSVKFEELSKLSYRVALSGAFPGAFPTTDVTLSIPCCPQPMPNGKGERHLRKPVGTRLSIFPTPKPQAAAHSAAVEVPEAGLAAHACPCRGAGSFRFACDLKSNTLDDDIGAPARRRGAHNEEAFGAFAGDVGGGAVSQQFSLPQVGPIATVDLR